MQVAINIPNVILATLMLILVIAGFVALFFGFVWLVSRVGQIFYRWLSQRGFYIELRRRQQEWWKRNKMATTWWLESIAEVVIDPAFYGYVLVTLYQRVQAISDYAKTHPQYSVWQLLNVDMETHMQYYVVLFIIFIAWMFWKLEKHRKEVIFERNTNRKLDKVLDSIEDRNKALEDLAKAVKQQGEDVERLAGSVEKLVDEIRKDREDRRGKSPTHM